MNLVDAVIVGAGVVAAFLGARHASRRVASLAGAALGIAVGAQVADHLPAGTDWPHHLRSALVLILGGSVGFLAVRSVWNRCRWSGRRSIRALTAVVVALFVAWVIAGVLPSDSTTGVAGEANASWILRNVDRAAPPLREIFRSTKQSTHLFGWPEPSPASRLPVPSRPQLEAAIALATPATVKVTGVACGHATAGSGVVIAPDLVVTTAHVVAGAEELIVALGTRARSGVPILVDPRADLAVLYVRALNAEPLPLAGELAERGAIGAVLGYPGGGPLVADTAVVLATHRASGHDIYGKDRVTREILEVQARIGPGASGGPLVDSAGAVLGILFGQSQDHSDIAYALTTASIRGAVEEANRLTQDSPIAVSTGQCLTS